MKFDGRYNVTVFCEKHYEAALTPHNSITWWIDWSLDKKKKHWIESLISQAYCSKCKGDMMGFCE